MWSILQQHLIRLKRDDSGVALVLTIAVSCFLFVLISFPYAVGESVRQKLELQTAADSAAYSGAVVQADILSRMAMINRAMSWTYIQMTRRQMDYAVDAWLEVTQTRFLKDFNRMKSFNSPSIPGFQIPMVNWNCGQLVTGTLQLNNSQTVFIADIIAARLNAATRGSNYIALQNAIQRDARAISSMNQALERYQTSMDAKIKDVIRTTLANNLQQNSGLGKVFYKTDISAASTYMAILKNHNTTFLPDEDRFLSYESGGIRTTPKACFGNGTNTWHVQSWIPNGIQRMYSQQDNALVATYSCFSTLWEMSPPPDPVPICVGVIPPSSPNIRGTDAPLVSNNLPLGQLPTQMCRPMRLTPAFFGRNGTITVCLARENTNPFNLLFKQPSGLYSIFNPSSNYILSVATARAGYKPPFNIKNGEYESSWIADPIGTNDNQRIWNLCETDWDAMLLPVAHAWDDASLGKFYSNGNSPLNLFTKNGWSKPSLPSLTDSQPLDKDLPVIPSTRLLHH